MIDFYTYPTQNIRKVGIMLEECALPCEVRVIDITEKTVRSCVPGDQPE